MNDLVQHQQFIKPTGASESLVDYEQGTPQHLPKFSPGSEVVWAYVSAHDYGVVVDCVWAKETVHKVTGWHYLVRLHHESRSYSLCQEDWAFEADLELLSNFNNMRGLAP
jgi:hypothetical protein